MFARVRSFAKPLLEFFDHCTTQPEFRPRQPLEDLVEVDQACGCGVGQDARSSGDLQAQCRTNPATSFFVDDQQAGLPLFPSERDGGSFTGIKSLGFLKIGCHIGQKHQPRLRSVEELPQCRGGIGMAGLAQHRGGDGHRAIELSQQVQFTEFGQTRQR